MKLIGMLDSPYVRRVAISLRTMGMPFEHQAVSVLSTFERFREINPVVKAPTLIYDDGTVLMDSTLILDFAESLQPPPQRLMPKGTLARLRTLRLLGLALAAADKAVQCIYETRLRPADKQYAPWLERVLGQLLAALTELEAELQATPLRPGKGQASITVAVVWQFIQSVLADQVPADRFPALQALSTQSEALSAFKAFPPVGPGVSAA